MKHPIDGRGQLLLAINQDLDRLRTLLWKWPTMDESNPRDQLRDIRTRVYGASSPEQLETAFTEWMQLRRTPFFVELWGIKVRRAVLPHPRREYQLIQ